MRKLLKAKSVTLIALLWLGLWGSPGEGQVDPACATWRWVGLKTDPNAPCPPATGWTSTTLSCSPANPPPGLRRFCLYQGGNENDLRALVPRQLQSIEQDCLAVIPAGGEIEQATWSELAEHFHNQAGGMLTDPVSAPVRLALIDTAATRTAAVGSYPGNSAHGYTLANLADNLLCDGDPNCVVDLTAQLALAYLSFDYAVASLSLRDDVDGGYAGTLFDLARAVRCEVEAWEQNPGNPHLVLNLSVAWNGELFGGHETLVDDMPLDVQAVYRAIGDAVCRGVVVVAAAGNVTGGPSATSGPLLPGGWERRKAPDRAACAKALETAPSPGPFPDPGEADSTGGPVYRPLVYAAGGVRSDGKPLANARPGGLPPMVAYGDHAVVGTTATLTGSSVSTLVVAAATAAVWHYRQDLKPHQVMDLVYHSGDDLNTTADFDLSELRPGIRRISLCRAVSFACAAADFPSPGAPTSCPTEPVSCPPWSTAGPFLSATALSNFNPPAANVRDAGTLDQSFTPSVCDPSDPYFYAQAAGPPQDPCPFQQFYGIPAEPWVNPQPQIDPCPNCAIFPETGTFYIEIAADFAGELTNLALTFDGKTYSLGLEEMESCEQARIDQLPFSGVAPDSASLTCTVDDTQSAHSAILVIGQ